MAIYAKLITGNDVIAGLATVGLGSKEAIPQNYDNRQRDLHWTDVNNLSLFTELDGRYQVDPSGWSN